MPLLLYLYTQILPKRLIIESGISVIISFTCLFPYYYIARNIDSIENRCALIHNAFINSVIRAVLLFVHIDRFAQHSRSEKMAARKELTNENRKRNKEFNALFFFLFIRNVWTALVSYRPCQDNFNKIITSSPYPSLDICLAKTKKKQKQHQSNAWFL